MRTTSTSSLALTILGGCLGSGKNEVSIETGADYTSPPVEMDTDTDADSDTDTGPSSTITGDTGATMPLPCDDAVTRPIDICWSPSPDLLHVMDGQVMVWNPSGNTWAYSDFAYGAFSEVCMIDWPSITNQVIKVQAVFTDFYEVPQFYGGTWWAIANYDGTGVESRGAWTIDGVETPVTVVGNDGEITTPACE